MLSNIERSLCEIVAKHLFHTVNNDTIEDARALIYPRYPRDSIVVAKSVSSLTLKTEGMQFDDDDFNWLEADDEVMFIPEYDPTSGFCLSGIETRRCATVFRVGRSERNAHYLALLAMQNFYSGVDQEKYLERHFHIASVFTSFCYQLLLSKMLVDQELEQDSIYIIRNREATSVEGVTFVRHQK